MLPFCTDPHPALVEGGARHEVLLGTQVRWREVAESYLVVRGNVRSRVLTARETADVLFREVAWEIVVHRREFCVGLRSWWRSGAREAAFAAAAWTGSPNGLKHPLGTVLGCELMWKGSKFTSQPYKTQNEQEVFFARGCRAQSAWQPRHPPTIRAVGAPSRCGS